MIKEVKEFVITDGDLPTKCDIYYICTKAKKQKFIGEFLYDGGKKFRTDGDCDPIIWIRKFIEEYGERIKNGSPDDYK